MNRLERSSTKKHLPSVSMDVLRRSVETAPQLGHSPCRGCRGLNKGPLFLLNYGMHFSCHAKMEMLRERRKRFQYDRFGLSTAIRCGLIEGPVWMAPAMQEVFGDFAAFCQYSRVSGLFMQHFQNTAGPPSHRCEQRLPGNGWFPRARFQTA